MSSNDGRFAHKDTSGVTDSARTEWSPAAFSLIFNERQGVNAETTFKTREKAEAYAKECSEPKPRVVALYVGDAA